MQFPLETVREVAHILQNQSLGEITLETGGARLTIKRAGIISTPGVPLDEVVAQSGGPEATSPAIVEAPGEQLITVASPAVGVYREGKKPLHVGDEVSKKASLGSVETLNIPTELLAPQVGRIKEILAIDGQGVEWGQPLLILEPLAE